MASSMIVLYPAIIPGLLIGLCPPEPASPPEDYVGEMQRAWATPRHHCPDYRAARGLPPLAPPEGVAGGPPPSEVGQWLPPIPWDVIAIHAAVLPTGDVLHFSYPDGSEGSRARVWDPQSGVFTEVDYSDDIFCAGHSHLADGRLYVTGGNDYDCEFQGRVLTNIFDPFTLTWIPDQDMEDGRWYPTNVTLPDGRVLVFTGLDLGCGINEVVELFTPGVGLEILPEGERNLDLYPRMHVLSDGRVAHVGPEEGAWTFTIGKGWDFITWSGFGYRNQGTSVLLPSDGPGVSDRIMTIGGNAPLTASCEIIDFTASDPEFQFTGSMHESRGHLNVVLLPDKTVMVIGGGQSGLYDNPVYVPELYDPATGAWTELPPQAYGRMYHSTAVLLPDGRVLSAGQDSGDSMFWGEIYQPPYLFRGPRPVIDSAPPTVFYDLPFAIATDEAATIESVVMIRLASVTHSVNFEQRLVTLAFSSTGAGSLQATAPTNANHAPPGYYLLFIVNGSGVPSEAAIVRVAAPADLNGDGVVNGFDLALLLGAWGPCRSRPECPADLDGNGVVNGFDLALLLGAWG